MKNYKIKLVRLISLFCLVVIAFGLLEIPVYAKSAMEQSVQDYVVTDPQKMAYPNECKTILITGDAAKGIKGFEPSLKEFLEFLDANFKNKSSASSLTDLAIARYREYRDDLRKQFKHVQLAGLSEANKEGGTAVFTQQVNDYAICEEMVNTYISLGRQEMIKHIKTNAAQKKTIMFLEKLKALNAKLRELNRKMADMYALFTTFANKFPGFVADHCMKSLGG